MKRCTKCQRSFPKSLGFFGPTTQNKSGLLARCRECMKAYYSAWSSKNPAKHSANSRRYYYKNLERARAQRKHYAQRRRVQHKATILRRQRERRHANIEQTRAEARVYRQEHPEIFRRAQQRWEQNHPDNQAVRKQRRRVRTQHLTATVTAQDWQFCLRYWHFACAVCGSQKGFLWTLAMDHWIPISSPQCPGTTPDNIIVLCHGIGGCNNSKHDKNPQLWLEHKLGKVMAKKKLQEIERYFRVVRERHG
jgi:hypothetical protein